MAAIVTSAVLVCAGALVVGQAVLRVCGAREWSWIAPPIGASVLMLLAVPAVYLPGRSVTVAVLLAVIVIAALVVLVRDRSSRPPLMGLLAGLPAAALALVPFLSSGYAGTLGVSFNNDMASHLLWAEAYGSEAIERVNEIASGYPMGAHALVAALARGLGMATDEVFAGLTVAVPVLVAWTALAALRRARWPAQTVVATVVGMPFLAAGYYAQGSFKELLQAAFVLAFAIAIQRREDIRGRLRWAPAALLVAGMLSVYSTPGLAWPVAILGLWVVGMAFERLNGGDSLRSLLDSVRANGISLGIGLLVLLVVLLPQLGQIGRFVSATAGTNGTGIETDSLGNLAGPLPLWEAFGIWDNPDYRLPPIDPLQTGVWIGLVLGLVILGTVWWVRRGDWALPAAAVAALTIWWVSDRTQAPYVAAKALMILTPILMLVAVRPLVESIANLEWRRPSWRWVVPAAAAIVLSGAVVSSSWSALRTAKVGPRSHMEELRELRPLLGERPTLFLGNDDYIRWELAGVPVNAPVISFQGMSTRREKPWTYGEPFDVDSLDAAILNEYDWIITPRDAAASSPPPEMRLVRVTPSFQLWRRTGQIEQRVVLAGEGANATALFDCATPKARRLLSAGGVAAVRRPTVVTPVGRPLAVGPRHPVDLPIADGLWTIQIQYESQHPIEVVGPNLRKTLPAALDRPGTRWHVGRMRVSGGNGARLRLRAADTAFTPSGRSAYFGSIFATSVGGSKLVPLREACGKAVDWIEPRR